MNHLPICNQTKRYLKDDIHIDPHKSQIYPSIFIDQKSLLENICINHVLKE